MPSNNTHSSHSSPEKENDSSSTRHKAQHNTHSSSRRDPLRTQNRSNPSDVPTGELQPVDDPRARIRELEAQIRQLRDAQPPPREPEIRSIARPKRVSDVTMAEICDELGFEKDKWIDLRSCTRDCLSAARLNTKLNWKAQDPTKLGMAYNAIEQDFPELRRFEGKWGVERIAKDTWDNRKSYKSCSRNPSTYVGRRAAARREARRRRSRLSSPLVSPPRSPARSSGSPSPPTPGPSQPPRARPQARRIPSSDDDSGDDLLNFPDHQDAPELQEEEEEEEEEEEPNTKGKKRSKSGGGSSGKRRRS
ncbi:hypothetical protein C8R43DRAFT_1131874 [Mycena crocata]|nr:hypothetical protein C8R43DRAFT_1131874 [Mycena crocata]